MGPRKYQTSSGILLVVEFKQQRKDIGDNILEPIPNIGMYLK